MAFPPPIGQRITSGAFKILIIQLLKHSLCPECLENWLETTYLTKQTLIHFTSCNQKKKKEKIAQAIAFINHLIQFMIAIIPLKLVILL